MQQAQLFRQMGLSETKSQVSFPWPKMKSPFFFNYFFSFLLCTGVIPSEYQRLLGINSAVSPGDRLAGRPQEGEGNAGACNPADFPALPSPFLTGMQEDQEQQGLA